MSDVKPIGEILSLIWRPEGASMRGFHTLCEALSVDIDINDYTERTVVQFRDEYGRSTMRPRWVEHMVTEYWFNDGTGFGVDECPVMDSYVGTRLDC